ncbi:hypothetical protein L1887_23925 [Cichorium endivia]|nr:hypothetical protein L1887_23925 [Cichorium endivia]
MDRMLAQNVGLDTLFEPLFVQESVQNSFVEYENQAFSQVVHMHEPIYRELVVEFLSTYQNHSFDDMENSMMLQFHLVVNRGVSVSWSLRYSSACIPEHRPILMSFPCSSRVASVPCRPPLGPHSSRRHLQCTTCDNELLRLNGYRGSRDTIPWGGDFITRLVKSYNIFLEEVVQGFRRAEPTWMHCVVLFMIGVLRMVGESFILLKINLPREVATNEDGRSRTKDRRAAKRQKLEDIQALTDKVTGMHRQIDEVYQ